eukprot:557590-Alexandrium_andersonii.AAC.1
MGTRRQRTKGLTNSRAARILRPRARKLPVAIVRLSNAHDLLHVELSHRGAIRATRTQALAAASHHDTR